MCRYVKVKNIQTLTSTARLNIYNKFWFLMNYFHDLLGRLFGYTS